jgi:hypothetical protein
MIHLERLQSAFSADVDLELNVGGHTFSVGKTGPGYAYLREPAQIPAGNAIMVVTVDGIKHVLNISVKHNHSEEVPFDNRIDYRILSESAPSSQEAEFRQLFLFDDPTDSL